MVPEDLNLTDSESGAVNQIIQYVVEMVAATTEEVSRKMEVSKADEFKLLSTMEEAAEVTMLTETRKG